MSSAASSTTRIEAASTPRPGSRTVARVFRAAPFHWVGDGFFVSSYFPRPELPAERVSPFLLMDYHAPHVYPALPVGQRGVGWHPHRGFETVSLAWEGAVAHTDNAGHEGTIGPGDVQNPSTDGLRWWDGFGWQTATPIEVDRIITGAPGTEDLAPK